MTRSALIEVALNRDYQVVLEKDWGGNVSVTIPFHHLRVTWWFKADGGLIRHASPIITKEGE